MEKERHFFPFGGGYCLPSPNAQAPFFGAYLGSGWCGAKKICMPTRRPSSGFCQLGMFRIACQHAALEGSVQGSGMDFSRNRPLSGDFSSLSLMYNSVMRIDSRLFPETADLER
jgi:hypothetical protein